MRSVQHAGRATRESRRMCSQFRAGATGLHSDQSDALIAEECVKNTDRVAAAADTRKDRIGQASLALENLAARLFADDAVKIADHHGVGMRSQRGPEQVMR